eukprot:503822_1
MGTYTKECAEGGAFFAAIIPGGIVLAVCVGASIAIEKGVEVSAKIKDKNYSRWQLPSSVCFSTKMKLIEADNLIPLFHNSQNHDLHFDQQLLSLASSTKSIILIIETRRSVKSLIRYDDHDLYVIRMSWNDDIYSAKMFYSLYCIANLVIWKGDTMVESKRFKSFVQQLHTDIHTNEYNIRKPAFLYFCYTSTEQANNLQFLEITKNAFFESFCGLNMFSSILGYKIAANKNKTKSVDEIIVKSARENSQRFVKLPFECVKNKSDHYKCPTCSKISDISDSKVCTQCIHCGDLNFNQ